jgi:hypothetical protein
MSIYSQKALDTGVVTGFAEDKIKAWHQSGIDADELIRLGRAFNGPVPVEVAERMLAWVPGVVDLPAITDMHGNVYTLPDRLSRFVVNPNTNSVINVAGSGYNTNLHIVMKEAIEAATDANVDIASVVMLGDGAHMGMSFRARDGVTLGGDWGGATPLIGFNSSLTGAITTQLDTSTVLRVCDNTMAAAAWAAKKALKVKRTRNSNGRVTAVQVREALEISFEQTTALVEELERMANMTVRPWQVEAVLDLWKPVPEEDGRGRTIAVNQHATYKHLFYTDKRNVFGETVAGMWQAHNTWQHWEQTARGIDDSITGRLDRMATRTVTGDVKDADAKFMSIIAEEFPQFGLVVA